MDAVSYQHSAISERHLVFFLRYRPEKKNTTFGIKSSYFNIFEHYKLLSITRNPNGLI
jgi:hypothetical protein